MMFVGHLVKLIYRQSRRLGHRRSLSLRFSVPSAETNRQGNACPAAHLIFFKVLAVQLSLALLNFAQQRPNVGRPTSDVVSTLFD